MSKEKVKLKVHGCHYLLGGREIERSNLEKVLSSTLFHQAFKNTAFCSQFYFVPVLWKIHDYKKIWILCDTGHISLLVSTSCHGHLLATA